ncbi:TIGR02302 family protein [Thioclava litoralis]|uniref:TIGR02302 family protein n=1 Tax=Thioclava litoralis TaxID=3076557 RepID=A0ABZ1E0Y5_9RHOB|nr:TIGR02302 family protein [Thioclava sp. FTW29]
MTLRKPDPARTYADPALRRVARKIAQTRLGLVVERGLRAFWPALSLCAVGMAALVFGILTLPAWIGWAGLGLWGLALTASLIAGWRVFRWPSHAEAVARVDETLPGRPLTALADDMALGGSDPASRALWQAHIARMTERAKTARAVRPNPDLAPRDPYALRLTAILLLVSALVFGAPSRMFENGALPGGTAPALAAMGPSWEGWAEPPRYTGQPGLYLNSLKTDTLTLPEGTRFSFRFYGDSRKIGFRESVSSPAVAPQDTSGTDVSRRDFEAVQSGIVEISGMAGRKFDIRISPDDAPEIRLTGAVERRADGKMVLPFHASDDYAVTSGQARIQLDLAAIPRKFGLKVDPEPREALIYDLPMPYTGSRKAFDGSLVEDAEKHAWANLPVKLELEVTDGRGQTGSSGWQAIVLPGRRFFDPLASAFVEMRQDLLWNRGNAAYVSDILKALNNRAPDLIRSAEVRVLLRGVIGRLDQGLDTPEARDAMADMLWNMAELVEDGGLSNALERMQRAQERLSEAMRNGASQDEIDKLMQELKDATDDYIRMLAERDQTQGDPTQNQDQQSQQITGDQLQQMMDEIQRLMKEGRMAEAQELLEQFNRMMQNMKVTQGDGQGQGGRQMQNLRDTLREQQELSDDAFRNLQNGQQGQEGRSGQDSQNGQNNQNGQAQDAPSPSGSGQSLSDRQRALRQELDRQKGLLPNLGSAESDRARQRLDDAGEAMGRAEDALRKGDNGRALDNQAEAIQSLREGMQALNNAQNGEEQRQAGQQQQGQQGQMRDGEGGQGGQRAMPRDPLGRSAGDGNRVGTEENMLQGENPYGRARDLLDEIRRRQAERDRSAQERDYLDRLLDRF